MAIRGIVSRKSFEIHLCVVVVMYANEDIYPNDDPADACDPGPSGMRFFRAHKKFEDKHLARVQ